MKFETETGSVYQINETDKQIRRLNGLNTPTVRMGKDGEWRNYAFVGPVEVGLNVMIIWGSDVPLLPDTCLSEGASALRTTTTSPVKTIIEE